MNVLNRITDETSEFVGGVYDGGMDLATKGAGLENVMYATGGLVVSALVSTGMTMIPFQRIPLGNVIRTGSLAFVGAGVFTYGMKNMNEPLGMASLVGGPILFGTALAQTLGYFGLLPRLQSMLTMGAEENLKGYTPMDSVVVDKTSYQPAQDYGADFTLERPFRTGAYASAGVLFGATLFGVVGMTLANLVANFVGKEE